MTELTADREVDGLRRALEDSRREAAASSETISTLEKALASARLAVSDRNDFIAGLAHDLRSPLTTITMNAGVLMRMVGATEPANPLKKPVLRIQGSSDQMIRFLSDLMDVTCADGDLVSCRLAPVAVAPLLEEARDTFRAQAEEAGLTLGLDVRVPADALVLCDEPRFRQLMRHLVENAIQFTSRGGSVTLGAEVQAASVAFRVKDTGPGIPAEQLPRLFDQFWKGKRLAQECSGLGLAIVRSLVESQGGVVSVESVPGEGSTFAFTLPRAPAA